MSKLLEDESMGLYYISEVTNEGCNTVESMEVVDKGHGIFFVKYEQTLQSFDVMNRNGRMYDADNIWECIQSEKIQSQLAHNGWFMELDHPMQIYKDKPLTPERIQSISFDRRCAVIKRPRIVGNLLKASIETTNNEFGEGIAKDIIAHGYQPMASARAIANLVNRNGKPYVLVKRLINYDLVNYASHREADVDRSSMNVVTKDITNGHITESDKNNIINGYDVMIPLKDILEAVGKNDINAQIIMESFDISPKNLIGFNDSHNQMIMKDNDNNLIYANISKESTKRVNDFFSNL